MDLRQRSSVWACSSDETLLCDSVLPYSANTPRYIYTPPHTHTLIHTPHTHSHTPPHTHTHTYTPLHDLIHTTCVHTHTHPKIHTPKHSCTPHTHKQTHKHTCMHTHTHCMCILCTIHCCIVTVLFVCVYETERDYWTIA